MAATAGDGDGGATGIVTDATERPAAGPIVAIPLYRAPGLIAPLVAALARCADELAALDARILFINDSPDDTTLAGLVAALPRSLGAVPVELWTNAENMGFVRTANRALERALAEDRDVVLLNSDALPTPGAFAEMIAVADASPAIAVVSPRSNNATICNSPYPDAFRALSGDAALAAHRAIERYLPRHTLVPTAVGFCLLIRVAMIRAFGLFDEVYGGGYNEENDFIRRCNRHGYRAALANRAFVHHVGSVSFALSDRPRDGREAANRAILDRRYPDYGALILRYFDGPEYRAQALLGGLVPDPADRLRLLFDCRSLTDAAARAAGAAMAAFAARHGARCEALRIGTHPAADIPAVRAVDEAEIADRPCAATIAFGLPATPSALVATMRSAPVTIAVADAEAGADRRQTDIDDPAATLALASTVLTRCVVVGDARGTSLAALPPGTTRLPDDPARQADALAGEIASAIATLDFATLRARLAWVGVLADRERDAIVERDVPPEAGLAVATPVHPIAPRARRFSTRLRRWLGAGPAAD